LTQFSLYRGTITEFSGKSGSGKTQLALHFSITCQISDEIKENSIKKDDGGEPKFNKVAYICGPFTPI